MKKTFSLLLVIVILFSMCSCARSKEPVTGTDIYFDTAISIKLYDCDDESIIDECFEKCEYFESVFSKTNKDSELYKLNHGELKVANKNETPYSDQTLSISYRISDDLFNIIETGLYYSKLTAGSFDITIEPLSSLWNFGSDSTGHVPSQADIEQAVSTINYRNIALNKADNTITLKRGSEDIPWPTIELGALAKGYVADALCDIIKDNGCQSAIIDLGGNIMCVGSKSDDEAFTVGVKKPFADRGDYAGSNNAGNKYADSEYAEYLSCTDVSVVTSGVYERCFEKDGVLYHHLLDPKTGYPLSNSLYSVTIISESSFTADCLSTVCFSLGLEKGMELINNTKNSEAIFITDDNKLHYSKGAKDYVK